jgi:hypothetical protein
MEFKVLRVIDPRSTARIRHHQWDGTGAFCLGMDVAPRCPIGSRGAAGREDSAASRQTVPPPIGRWCAEWGRSGRLGWCGLRIRPTDCVDLRIRAAKGQAPQPGNVPGRFRRIPERTSSGTLIVRDGRMGQAGGACAAGSAWVTERHRAGSAKAWPLQDFQSGEDAVRDDSVLAGFIFSSGHWQTKPVTLRRPG